MKFINILLICSALASLSLSSPTTGRYVETEKGMRAEIVLDQTEMMALAAKASENPWD